MKRAGKWDRSGFPQRKPKNNAVFVLPQRVYFPRGTKITVGSGNLTIEEVTVDDKGRILIPKEIREKIGLKTGAKARLKVEKEKIIIMAPISPEDFIKEMEGCIKEGTPIIDPLELKKMWGPKKVGTT